MSRTYEEKVKYFAGFRTNVGDNCPNCVLEENKNRKLGVYMDKVHCGRCGWNFGGVKGLAPENEAPIGDPIPGMPEPPLPKIIVKDIPLYQGTPDILLNVPSSPSRVVRGVKKIYIAGPMTGHQDYNAPAFRKAAADLRSWGFDVVSPVELDEAEGVELDGKTGKADGDWKHYLARDLIRLLQEEVDAIVVLDGWERSKGATLEVAVAQAFDLPVLIYPGLERYTGVSTKAGRHPASQRFHEILNDLGELHDRKQKDYGRKSDPFANVRAAEEWEVPSWVGAMIRANDKIRRLQAFARTGTLANEGVEDAFLDLAVYAVIGLVMYEQGKDNNGK